MSRRWPVEANLQNTHTPRAEEKEGESNPQIEVEIVDTK